jgi:adenine-specific DNA-methyltransferase
MNTQKINKIVKTDIKEGLKKIFPQIFEDNKINFDKLRALLSGEIIEKEDDRFYFNWAGKSNLYKIIQAPAYGTLKPDKERSVDFDNTENIVIVGENLETLKLLLKPYFGKVKMIYIDPPYNTGKDFIYRDNFTQPLKDYLEKTGQIDSQGKKLTTNTEASGRYHSDWLNFMYPRLFLARSLLRDDGVIFVSIDDHEVHHLRMIMDEIFGEENFVAKVELLDTINVVGGIIKNKFRLKARFIWVQDTLNEEIKQGTKVTLSKNLKPNVFRFDQENKFKKPPSLLNKNMKIGTNEDAFDELKTIFGREKLYNYPKPTTLISYLAKTLSLNDKGFIILDFFAGSGTTGHAVWDLNKEDGGNRKFILVQLDEEVQDEEIKKEFPTVADICIERLRRVSEKYKKEREEQLIKNEMDFGFKVFKLDKSNFNLKDEFEFDPSEDKEELKKKYLEWLGMFVDQPLVSGWKEIDVIYEVMLKEGLNLNSKIEKVKIKNDEFYYVKDEGQNLEFYISLKDKFSKDTIEEIRTSKYKERMFVFLDNALTDSDKINLSAFVRLKVI